jgi:putative NADH-flavin reductase
MCPSTRLVVVGDAGSLEIKPGVVKADLPGLVRAEPRTVARRLAAVSSWHQAE